MEYHLKFSRLCLYDSSLPGISIPITLRLKDSSVAVDAKLDTGATDCIFARKYGEQLGLDIEQGERIRVGTATGSFTVWRHEVTLEVFTYSLDIRVLFADDDSFDRNVVGRHGFLDQVRLGLVDYDGELYLNPYNE